MLQASKMELGGHCGCGFRYISESLKTPVFSELFQTQGHHQPFSKQYLLPAAGSIPVVPKSPSPHSNCNHSKPPTNSCLTSNLCNLAIFLYCLYKVPHFAVCAVLRCSVVCDSLQPHGLQSTRLLCPWGFSKQEYWSGLVCPPPGDLPNAGIEPSSLTVFNTFSYIPFINYIL